MAIRRSWAVSSAVLYEGRFTKDCTMALTAEEFEELAESFDYNDSDKDGMIEFPEFVAMLNALEAGVAVAEARVGFNEIDSDDDGSIDLDEFIEWWTDR
jgi:Ca2+-binding EF-hand superfamily protein